MDRTEQSDRRKPQSIEEAILLALKGLGYGSAEIMVHDSQVVQIERKEKTRFDSTASRQNPRVHDDDSQSLSEVGEGN